MVVQALSMNINKILQLCVVLGFEENKLIVQYKLLDRVQDVLIKKKKKDRVQDGQSRFKKSRAYVCLQLHVWMTEDKLGDVSTWLWWVQGLENLWILGLDLLKKGLRL